MAIKSSNQQGNPYHDEATGQFTKKDGGGSLSLKNEQQEEHQAMKMFGLNKDLPMKLGTIDDIKAWREQKQQEKQNTPEIENENKGFKKAKNISEAIDLANDFVNGKTHIVWAKNTNIDAANEMNEAIYDVHQDFPQIFEHLINITNTNVGINVDSERKRMFEKIETLTKTMNLDEKEVEILKNKMSITSKSFENLARHKTPTGDVQGIYTRSETNSFARILGGKSKALLAAIRVNQSSTVNKAMFDIEMTGSVLSGFSMPGSKGSNYDVLVHELGHAVHLSLENFMDEPEKDFINKKFILACTNKETSDYGKTKYQEFVAEAFIDYYSNNKQPKNKISGEIIDFCKKVYSKHLT